MIFSNPRQSDQEYEMALQEAMSKLQIQISKLASRRLHLQSLIAKRDRLDYEIRCLKQRIKEDKKASTRTGKTVKEETISLLESGQQDGGPWCSLSDFEKKVAVVEAYLTELKNEEELLSILESLPRLGEL